MMLDTAVAAPYQLEASNFITFNKGKCIIGDDMGIGKSFESLYWCEKNKKKALIVCPASVQYNWCNEIEKFTTSKGLIVNSRTLKVKKAKIDYTSDITYLIMSWNYLSRYVDKKLKNPKNKKSGYNYFPKAEFMEVLFNGFDTIIFDEAHFMGNNTSIRTRSARCLALKMWFRLFLSGTAIKNKPLEFYPILNLVDPKHFSNWYYYATTFCGATKGKRGMEYGGATNLDLLHSLIKPFYIRRRKEEVIEQLPKKTRQMLFYDLHKMPDYGKIIEEIQMSTGTSPLAEITALRKILGRAMVKNTIEFAHQILNATDSKIIIGSMFRGPLDDIKEEFGDKAILFHGDLNIKQKDNVEKTFNNEDSIRIIGGTITSMGVGLNITSADKIIVNDCPWTPADCFQFEDRSYRRGQVKNVNAYYVGFRNTYHELIFDLINNKNQICEQILDGKIMTDGHVLQAIIKFIKKQKLCA